MNTKKTEELEGGNKTEKEEIDTARTVHWGGGIWKNRVTNQFHRGGKFDFRKYRKLSP